MSIFAIWPMILIVGAAIALLSLRRPFAFLDSTPTTHVHRLNAIDGLRGFLATAVVFHHFLLHSYGAKTGHSMLDVSHFYGYLGPAGVAVFFMITGYLFWDRLLAKGDSINWPELYLNRVFRIYPLYLSLVLAYFVFVLIRSDWQITQPASQVIWQVSQWLALGAVNEPSPFLGMAGAMSVVGQTWSLHYEWMFYFALPLLALVARERTATAATASALFFILLTDGPFRFFIAEFLCGMFAASALRRYPALRGDSWGKSLCALAMMTAAFRFTDSAYSNMGTLLLGAFFFLVASGASLFGLFRTRGAERLGNMSYSIYLLHGFVLTIIMTRPTIVPYAFETNEHLWLVGAYFFLWVVATSAVTYFVIERGGVALGRRAQAALFRRHVTVRPTMPI